MTGTPAAGRTPRRAERLILLVLGGAVGVVVVTLLVSGGDGSGADRRSDVDDAVAITRPLGAYAVDNREGAEWSVCAVLDGGAARCAGEDAWGEHDPPADTRFFDVRVGYETSCGITDRGELRCWGLKDGRVTDPSGFVGFTSFSGMCARYAGERSMCFDLGAPNWTRTGEEVGHADFVQVDGMNRVFCGPTAAGSARCSNGYRDPGGEEKRFVPPAGLQLQHISLGYDAACGIDDAQEVHCWGRAGSMAMAPPGPFVDLSVGSDAACGLRPDGEAVCWGNSAGDAPSDRRFVDISVARTFGGFACGATTEGEVACWLPWNDGSRFELLREELARW